MQILAYGDRHDDNNDYGDDDDYNYSVLVYLLKEV